MQAWNQVQVTNQDSVYHGVAGLVVRVESDAVSGHDRVFVRMDSDDSVQAFDTSEITILG